MPLPLPRRTLLWPCLAGLGMALNALFQASRLWPERPWPALGLGLLGLAAGVLLALQGLVFRWAELGCDGARLVLKPGGGLARLPGWMLRPFTRAHREGFLELPLGEARLEWVGRTLLLHGHPESDVVLGRGATAERVAAWLQARGVPAPVGR